MAITPVGTPYWLEALLSETFFIPCLDHPTYKKNEKKIFCLDCCCSLCPHCVRHHHSHRRIQIRRYVYQDVVRLLDIHKLIDCGDVQCYVANNSRVIFLNVRPHSRPFRGSNNACRTCQRPVQPPGRYCCIACKIGCFFERAPVTRERLQRERGWAAVEAPPKDDADEEEAHPAAPVSDIGEHVSASDNSLPDCGRALAETRRGEEVESPAGTRKKQCSGAEAVVARRAGGGAPVRKNRRKSSCPTRAPFF